MESSKDIGYGYAKRFWFLPFGCAKAYSPGHRKGTGIMPGEMMIRAILAIEGNRTVNNPGIYPFNNLIIYAQPLYHPWPELFQENIHLLKKFKVTPVFASQIIPN